jgi:hypothetical protein
MKKLYPVLSKLSKRNAPGKKKTAVKGYIESINNRQLQGWAIHMENKPLTLSLRLNDKSYPLSPAWNKRSDVAAKLGDDAFLLSGFVIDVPEALLKVFALARQQGAVIDVIANDVPLGHLEKPLDTATLIEAGKPGLPKPYTTKTNNPPNPVKINKLFVCIGAQKSGTSWLFENLSQDHRFSRCPFVKEIHYFDTLYKNSRHLNNWRANFFLQLCQGNQDRLKPFLSAWLSGDTDRFNKLLNESTGNNKVLARRFGLLLNELTDDWYADLLRTHKGQEYALDITPDYAVIGKKGFEHIKSIANDVKILFILRNPVDRAWSGLLQGKKQLPGGISGFLDEKGADIDYLFKASSSGPDVGARNNYLMTLKALDAAGLLDGRVLIKFYDEIADTPEHLIGDIYQFLGIPAPSMDIFSATLRSKVYATQKTVMPARLRARLKNHYSGMLKEINDRFVKIPDNWL